jgi:hypothetical protein
MNRLRKRAGNNQPQKKTKKQKTQVQLNQGEKKTSTVKTIKTRRKKSKRTPEDGKTAHVHGLAELIP